MKTVNAKCLGLSCTGMLLQILLQPACAAAHLVTTGMGPVYDGIGHMLLTPEDLVPALAIAVYAGLRGKAAGRLALFLLPLVWLMGGGMAGLYSDNLTASLLPAVSFIFLGLLIATDLYLPLWAFTLVLTGIGLTHGFFSGIALQNGAGFYGMLGMAALLFVLTALLAAFILSLRQQWSRVVVRVSGSWVAAIGLLMIGWYIRGQS